jgi:hypothetical protein
MLQTSDRIWQVIYPDSLNKELLTSQKFFHYNNFYFIFIFPLSVKHKNVTKPKTTAIDRLHSQILMLTPIQSEIYQCMKRGDTKTNKCRLYTWQ